MLSLIEQRYFKSLILAKWGWIIFNVQKSCGILKMEKMSVAVFVFPVGVNLEAIFSTGTLSWDQKPIEGGGPTGYV